jgi:hypothetical protein
LNVYIYPWSSDLLQDRLFRNEDFKGPTGYKWIWYLVKELLEREGICVHTADAISNAESDDVFVALSKIWFRDNLWHHYSRLAYEKRMHRRILLEGEPPVISPNMYIGMRRLSGIFNELYYCCKLSDTFFSGPLKNLLFNHGIESAKYFRLSASMDTILESKFERRSRRFMVMINANKYPILPYRELYSSRIKAVNYFGYEEGFDLYGKWWNRITFYPHILDMRAVRACYKGIIPSLEEKYDVLSKYTFSLCFENCRIEGYSTERIFDCFSVGTIPIYYGDPLISQMIPRDCFIDFSEFQDFRLLNEYLRSLSEDDVDRYRRNIRQFMHSPAFDPFKVETFVRNFMRLVIKGCW